MANAGMSSSAKKRRASASDQDLSASDYSEAEERVTKSAKKKKVGKKARARSYSPSGSELSDGEYDKSPRRGKKAWA